MYTYSGVAVNTRLKRKKKGGEEPVGYQVSHLNAYVDRTFMALFIDF